MAPKDQPICRDAEKGRTKRKVPLPWDIFFFPLLSFNCLLISFSLHHFITTLHTFFFPLFIIMFLVHQIYVNSAPNAFMINTKLSTTFKKLTCLSA